MNPPLSFEQFVVQCAEHAHSGAASDVIYNKSVPDAPGVTAEHASIIIRHLLLSAIAEVRILSGSLNPLVYGDPSVAEAMLVFLRRQPRARAVILLDWQPNRPEPFVTARDLLFTNPFLIALRTAGVTAEQLHLHEVPADVVHLYPYHFIVADKHSFRFEEDRAKFDAVAQFGNAHVASNLAARFDEIKKLCQAPVQF
jgi:hypothetical protein